MSVLYILLKKPPKSCGPISSEAYLQWKMLHCERWRFPENRIRDEDVPKLEAEPIIFYKEHKATVGDLVYLNDELIGKITSVDRHDGQEVHVGARSFELDWFDGNYTAKGRGPAKWDIQQ